MYMYPTPCNLKSAYDHSQIVRPYLDREVQLGRMAVLSHAEVAAVSPLGLQIGSSQSTTTLVKWRLIVNLSALARASTNDAIDPELSSIAYTSIDDTAHLVTLLRQGCLMAKFDSQEAYRAVPVHPLDQIKLGVKWNRLIHMDRALPFGLRSAPKLFSALSDGFMWLLHKQGISHALHYPT